MATNLFSKWMVFHLNQRGRMLLIWVFSFFCFSAHLLGSPAFDSSEEKVTEPLKVMQVLPSTQGGIKTVLLNRGTDNGVSLGDMYIVERPLGEKTHGNAVVQTGKLKVIQVFTSRSIAHISENGSEGLRLMNAKFAEIMAGDRVRLQAIPIERTLRLMPTETIAYADLFMDPKANPQTFELTETGKGALARVAKEFVAARIGPVLIEGYTDSEGKEEDNQIEAYQRALTVRQFLIAEHGFDPERLVAVGMGELGSHEGESQATRAIVVRPVPD